MKTSCSIVQDIIPLYLDQVCSDDSKEMVLNHLEECETCKRIYEKMSGDNHELENINENNVLNPTKVLKRIKRIIQIRTVLLLAFALLNCGYWAIDYLFQYGYVNEPYIFFEMMGLYLCFMLIILFILWIVLLIKARLNRSFKGYWIYLILLVFITAVDSANIYYSAHMSTVSGIFHIEESKMEGNNYYIVVKFQDHDVKIPCSYEVYDSVITDPEVIYDLEFYYNTLTSNTARMSFIDLKDYIDNRNKHPLGEE